MRVLSAEAAAIAAAETVSLLPGRCGLCGASGGFASGPAQSLREGLACRGCGCNARQRAAAGVLLGSLALPPRRAVVTITEQASRLFLALRRRVGRLHGSEYLNSWSLRLRMSLWLWRHGVVDIARHGDVTALETGDGRVDAIVSLDVLEHVPDYRAALREFARVLKSDGVLVLTVPFHQNQADNRRIAELDAAGGVRFLGEPEYHGDPLSGGVACFHHFGWQLLQELRRSGFATAEARRIQDPDAGLPQGQWVIVARR
ncbi:class I SAM-dependent methyltransferase [Marilutibacter maris]|uniref:Methyltransferase domain-containing protein n=1 Tax=Marilutibacter maris TaxID=1605891 RepID=A0A508ATU3_9GAMM|nr:class I SAM-dependent methyltransferase [Lysobacter maris]KAB8188887.1 methyltransferase domain-containing protein [Lysobacter maris]